ncbi:MAG TPA: divalent-cation tolerance protein CutA [Stellaceae bacterium]|nr:divalent-cation tolerance protein CutA [Stellaceae bacterium]
MDVFFVYVTVPGEVEAERIARAAVEGRLAAAANILPGGRSVYRWQGAVNEAAETVLVLKTAADRLAALTDRVRALHPYEVPCIAALPVVGGLGEYLAWIVAETRPNTAFP